MPYRPLDRAQLASAAFSLARRASVLVFLVTAGVLSNQVCADLPTGSADSRELELRCIAVERREKAVPELERALKNRQDLAGQMVGARWLGRLGPAGVEKVLRRAEMDASGYWGRHLKEIVDIAASLAAARHGESLEDGVRAMGGRWGWRSLPDYRPPSYRIGPDPPNDQPPSAALSALREAVWALADAKSKGRDISRALRHTPYRKDPQCVLRLQLAGMEREERIKFLVDRLASIRVIRRELCPEMQALADEGGAAVVPCVRALGLLLKRGGEPPRPACKALVRVLSAIGSAEAIPVFQEATRTRDPWVSAEGKAAIGNRKRGVRPVFDLSW